MRNSFIILFTFCFALCFTVNSSLAQQIEIDSSRIDAVLEDWNTSEALGGVIAISVNGEVKFLKAGGLASLEYEIPIKNNTMFNIGSLAKQFTVAGILVLCQEGKLNLEDDINKYLKDLPEFSNPIKIHHLIHHTSGLRSMHALLALAGWRGDDRRTNDDIYRFIKKQKELNFNPGDKHLYSNTGYILMAQIIENITGEKFDVWIKDNVFLKLGMEHTFVQEAYHNVRKSTATSYYTKNRKAVEFWDYTGSGNVYSNVEDLLIWIKNFHSPQSGWENLFSELTRTRNLKNGETNSYAGGVVIDSLTGGIHRIKHGGSVGGYQSFICSYPDYKIDMVILSNYSSSRVERRAEQISRIIFKEISNTQNQGPISTDEKNSVTRPLSLTELEMYKGDFLNKEDFSVKRIGVENDTLVMYHSSGQKNALINIGTDIFKMEKVPVRVVVRFDLKNGNKNVSLEIEGRPKILYESFEYIAESPKESLDYIGDYFSDEIETNYKIFTENDKFKWYHPRHGIRNLKRITKDIFKGEWPLMYINFKRDQNNSVTGMSVSNGRVKKLRFKKVNDDR